MKRAVLAIAAAMALGGASGIAGHAAAAPQCHDAGSANVKDLGFEPAADLIEGLSVSFKLGLQPAEFPARDIADNPNACRRGQVAVGGVPVQIYGDDKDSPPRWAISPDGRHTAYFAMIPDPGQALDWSHKHAKDPKVEAQFTSMLYALVVTDGDRRLIYTVTRVLPDDYHLSGVFRAVLEGRWKPFAVMDAKTGEVDLSQIAIAGTQDSATGIAKTPQKFRHPDGVFFVAEADGGASHARSGLNCPAQIGVYRREEMAVLNPADGGIDLMCRFFSPGSWFSVFDTLFHNTSLDAVFAGYLKDSQGVTPPERSLPPPGPLKSTLPYKATFWVGKEGGYQGLWVARRGEWYIELRATYKPGEEAAVTAFAQKMLDLLAASST